MDSGKLQRVLTKKTKKIAKLCEAVSPGFDEEVIHDFRTQVKRLRSLLSLVNMGKDEPEVKISPKFKRLYHIAGAIRDVQQEAKKIVEWEVNLPVYSSNLAGIIARQKEEWENHYKKKIVRRFQEKITGQPFEKLNTESLVKLFNVRLDGIRKVSSKKAPTNEQVHSVRKQVKDMLYNSAFAEKKWKKAFKKIEQFPLKDLNRLSEVIGDYNDARIILDHLQCFKLPDAKERGAITTIMKNENNLQRVEKKKVLAKVAKFTASVPKHVKH